MEQTIRHGATESVEASEPIIKDVQGREVANVRSPEYRNYYCNSVSVISSTFDIRLLIGDIGPDASGAQAANTVQCGVVMSWEHAKALSNLLKARVEEHESMFGPLYLKPKIQE